MFFFLLLLSRKTLDMQLQRALACLLLFSEMISRNLQTVATATSTTAAAVATTTNNKQFDHVFSNVPQPYLVC